MWTRLDYDVFLWWESGVWWRYHGVTYLMVPDDYHSPYQA